MKTSFLKISGLLVAALVVFSCSKESADLENTPEQTKAYKVSVNAKKCSTKLVTEDGGKGVTTFDSHESIYFCNLSDGNKIDKTPVNPTPDGADAHKARIVGTLSGKTSADVNITYAKGNLLRLMYNVPSTGLVDYNSQAGDLDNVVEAAVADNIAITNVTTENEITTAEASFENLQSIFKFTFVNEDSGVEISNIRFVRVFSNNNKLQSQYNVVSGTETYGPVTISRDNNLSNNYIYAGLRFASNPGDVIVFQVVDAAGNVYSGSKTAPASGFANSKFYTSTVNVKRYTFTTASGKKVCFSPGDLGLEIINSQSVYSFTEPFTTWGHGNTTNYNKAEDAKAVAKRVWFDFYFESGLRENATLYGITGWRVPTRLGSSVESYEWNYLINSRTMNSSVNSYYKVTISGQQYCLLLPPDETQSSDIGEDLTSGTVTDYVKYLGKGFVLLFNTNRAIYSSNKWSWGGSTSPYAKQGWYWTWYNNSNRYYFTWPDSGPIVDWGSNRMRNHIRYVHDID